MYNEDYLIKKETLKSKTNIAAKLKRPSTELVEIYCNKKIKLKNFTTFAENQKL